jgi:hypothetical protein
VQGAGFRVQGAGFRVQGAGFRDHLIDGSGRRAAVRTRPCSAFRVQGQEIRFRVQGRDIRAQVSRWSDEGSGVKVHG